MCKSGISGAANHHHHHHHHPDSPQPQAMTESPMPTKQTLQFFTQALKSFSASQDALRVLCSVPRSAARRDNDDNQDAPRKLIVLDSSFNPPTTAHAHLASSAVQAAPGSRLMLLLAVNNADKAPVPAAFPVRLAMMEAFAQALQQDTRVDIDLAVTTEAYFHAKSAAIVSLPYCSCSSQVFLCGFDTLVRIFNPKYYPGNTMRTHLGPFFERATLRVTVREDEVSAEEQVRYVACLGAELDKIGGED
jgi:nicotinamide-nucleotide adenylyltransferase